MFLNKHYLAIYLLHSTASITKEPVHPPYHPTFVMVQDPNMPDIPNGGADGSMTIFLEPMQARLQVISSVLLHNTVYISGVAVQTVPKSDQVQVYSFCTNKWSTLPKGPNYNAPIAVIDNQITLIGGRDSETNAITSIMSTWVEDEREWKQNLLPSMPTKRLESGVCHHDNLLLVTGGIMESTEERGKCVILNTVDVYNIDTGRWSTPKALKIPMALPSHHLVVVEENIYLAAGGTTFPVEDSEKHINAQAWRAAWSDVKEAIEQDAGVSLEPPKPVDSMWTPIEAPPVLRPTVISYQSSLISIGGVKDGSPQNTIYEFVNGKVDNSWIVVGNMRVGRYRHGVVTLGKHGAGLFVAGGFVQGNPMEDEVNIKSPSVEVVFL